jgi:hypothetical protein
MPALVRVHVTSRPNPSEPGAVLLTFAEDCPYCGQRHQHGDGTPETDADGTYGTRVPHCSNHTHEVNRQGRPARVTDQNICPNDHPLYVLVPAEAVR